MGKRQSEIPGTERKSIDTIDEWAALHLQSAEAVATAKEKARHNKAMLLKAMETHKEDLEEDSDGNKVYLHVDGDERTAIVLVHSEGIRCRKQKQIDGEEEEEDEEIQEELAIG